MLVCFTSAGAAATWALPESYRSTAVVLVTPTGLPDSPEGSVLPRTESVLNLETEAEMVLSADVVSAAAATAGDRRGVSAVRADVLVKVPDNTAVLRITAQRPRPGEAQRLAQAFSDAYLSSRRAEAEAVRTSDLDGLDKEISALTTELAKVSRRIPGASSQAEAYGLARQRVLLDQLGTARNSRDRLAATHVGGGSVLSAASPGARPLLSPGRFAGPAGLVLGLVAAVVAVSWLSRKDRLVRSLKDAERLTGSALIGYPGLTLSAASSGQIDLLRQDVDRLLPESGGVLLVVGTGPACAELLTGLAAAQAAAGRRTTLVGADFTDPSTAEALGVPADHPGLAEAVLRHEPLSEVFPLPGLRFVPPGQAGPTGSGLLPSSAMTAAIEELRLSSEVVLLQVPLSEAALAARFCDAAVFFVQIGSTQRDDLTAVARQLQVGGTEVVGTVCLNRSRSSRRPVLAVPRT